MSAGAVVKLADVPVITEGIAVVEASALSYASRVRAVLLEVPSVMETTEPALAASAVRLNTHEVMSGLPSCAVPSSVQPGGVVAVVELFAVTMYTNWVPGSTDVGTEIVGVADCELASATACSSTAASGAIASTITWVVAVAPSSSVIVSNAMYVPASAKS